MFGLRYDRFDSKGDIPPNPQFTTVYGFNNSKDLDGLDIFLPRASFLYDVPLSDAPEEGDFEVTFRGGVGRYSGGAPNVWVSNNYSNNGLQQVLLTGSPTGGSSPLAGIDPNFLTTSPGGGLTNLEDVHPLLQSLLAGLSSNGTVNALSPDFELPSIYRANLGADMEWDGWQATAEFLYMDALDQLYYQDLRMVQRTTSNAFGTTISGGRGPDGRIIYDHISDVNPLIVRPRTGNDLVLKNADKGEGQFIILGVGKTWDYASGNGDLRINLGYVNSNVDDLGGLTSSVAFSNFTAPARANMNEPEVGRSDYERKHVLKGSVSTSWRFFEMLESRLFLFGQSLSGQGISYTFSGNPFVDNINPATNPGGVNVTYNDNQPANKALLYVPRADATTGQVICGTTTATSSDPAVFFDPGFNCAGFNTFLAQTHLMQFNGQISPRNYDSGPYITRIDLGFEQEINLFGDHRAVFEFNIFNFGNMINKKWGLWQTPVFQNFQSVVNANYDAETNTYRYNSFTPGNGLQTNTSASQWQLQLGVRYEF